MRRRLSFLTAAFAVLLLLVLPTSIAAAEPDTPTIDQVDAPAHTTLTVDVDFNGNLLLTFVDDGNSNRVLLDAANNWFAMNREAALTDDELAHLIMGTNTDYGAARETVAFDGWQWMHDNAGAATENATAIWATMLDNYGEHGATAILMRVDTTLAVDIPFLVDYGATQIEMVVNTDYGANAANDTGGTADFDANKANLGNTDYGAGGGETVETGNSGMTNTATAATGDFPHNLNQTATAAAENVTAATNEDVNTDYGAGGDNPNGVTAGCCDEAGYTATSSDFCFSW